MHICAWCGYKFRRALPHREQDCLKKRTFLDKKAVADANNANTNVSGIDLGNCNMVVQLRNCTFAENIGLSQQLETPTGKVTADRLLMFNFSLPTIATLEERLLIAGAGSWFLTADLSRAYHQLKVCQLLVPLLGIAVQGQIYVDIAPPFGCQTSALACACTTRVVVWLLRQKGFFSLGYLDDFVGIESSRSKAEEAYEEFIKLHLN